MDPFTHILFGNACALGATRHPGKWNRELARRVPVATAAALFPDIDYLGFWIDPLIFLADWHRGFTHSLVLLPLWAGLVTLPFLLSGRYRTIKWELYGVACLVLASHLLLDLVTVYGTQLFAPLSDARFSLAITFVVDPLITLPLLIALAACLRWPARTVLAICFLYLGGYWTAQYLARQQALERVAASSVEDGRLFAIPQPFSPFYWMLIQQRGEGHRVAYLDLLGDTRNAGWRERLGLPVAEYRPLEALRWRRFTLFGDGAQERDTARAAWRRPGFEPFRRFARFPALYAYEENPVEVCVWFTDLRYVLPFMEPPFRYGSCRRSAEGVWRGYRLTRFDGAREPLPSPRLQN